MKMKKPVKRSGKEKLIFWKPNLYVERIFV